MTKLTEEMVIARSRQSDLASIKKLNCWGSDLSDVSIITRMRGVEVLALSVNKITSLQPFENCRNLQELYLRKNNIQDIAEIAYLQNLPKLKYLWLEENPCCEQAGPSYRSIVLRALPDLVKLDNIDVTPEEVEEALNSAPMQKDEDVYEDAYDPPPQQQQTQSQYSSPQQQRASQSPPKERSPTNQDYSPPQEQIHPPSPKYNNSNNTNNSRDNRMSYHQYDRSPGSDQDSPSGGGGGSGGNGGYRDRGPMPPSISTHSMKEYYQSDRPTYPAHYRHSQNDLTEWEEHQHNQYNNSGGQGGHGHPAQSQHRRSAGTEREISDRFAYRNGNAARDNGEWEDSDRPRSSRRPDGRFSDSASVVSAAVLNHYTGYHRRPVNRSSNLLSATLCLVKELDYPSLEVVEHAVRCRIDELAGE